MLSSIDLCIAIGLVCTTALFSYSSIKPINRAVWSVFIAIALILHVWMVTMSFGMIGEPQSLPDSRYQLEAVVPSQVDTVVLLATDNGVVISGRFPGTVTIPVGSHCKIIHQAGEAYALVAD